MPYADREQYLAYQRARYRSRPEEYKAAAVRNAAKRPAHIQASYVSAIVANKRSKQKITGAELRSLPQDCCAYCGGPPEQIDHCTPLARGGTNTLDNIVYACAYCNLHKADRTVLEFVFNLPRLGPPRIARLHRGPNATKSPNV
jgi:5-methylcytosine-specific restriction endonuclease McrA